MKLNKYFKSIVDTDRQAVVICDVKHTIIYMNPAAIKRYEKYGGENLIGKSILSCHNQKSGDTIKKVVDWFSESINNNIIYTFHNDKDNRDVYMVAIRDEENNLIGYYEKHESRNKETMLFYNFEESICTN